MIEDLLDLKIRASIEGLHMVKPTACDQAGVVHDLGNLLQVVSSALGIISREANVTNATRLNPVFAAARSSLERAGRLIRQSLGSAREGGVPVEYVDLAKCITGLKATIQSVRASEVRIEVVAAPGLGLLCNPVELDNAVLNLAINAIDAMPGGGVLLVEAGKCGRQPDEEIYLRVTDNGSGMCPETAARAADPYFTTKESCGGSGVGLATVARFANRAGGRIEIESVLGHGTTIGLYFPAAPGVMGDRVSPAAP